MMWIKELFYRTFLLFSTAFSDTVTVIVVVYDFQYNFPKTIVDSGTTDLRLPDKVYKSVLDHIKKYVQVW